MVGIAADARDIAPDIAPQATVYVPFAESPDFSATLLTRSNGQRSGSTATRATLRESNALLMIGETRSLSETHQAALAPRRFTTTVLLTFAGIGLVIAGVGLYGLIAISVAHRTREFGIRIALGGTWRDIRHMVLREAGLVVGIGAMIGTVSAAMLTQFLRAQLFGVTPLDGWTWIGTGFLLCGAGFVAAWLPARRAASIEPAVALRGE